MRQVEHLARIAEDQLVGPFLGLIEGLQRFAAFGGLSQRVQSVEQFAPVLLTLIGDALSYDPFDGEPSLGRIAAGGERFVARPQEPGLGRLILIYYGSFLMVLGDSPPKAWEDLLNPRWKGKLILDDSNYEWFVGMLDYMGEQKGLEYMKKLAQNGVQIQQGRANAENLVAAGEVPIMVAHSGSSVALRMAKGDPVAFVKDPHPPIAYGEGISIMANAPHPYAAALFMEAVLTEKWQRGAAEKILIRPARSGLPDPLIDLKIKPHFTNPEKWPPDRYNWAQREYVRILVRKDF